MRKNLKERVILVAGYGKPLFDKIHYCTRCCMPETTEGIEFDEMGICQACQSAEQKMHIDWLEREKELRRILEHYKGISGDNYDCIVPISGGKDSTFQLYVVTQVYGMKPLAVTASHNWFSEEGRQNLWNALERFDVDHIMYTPNRKLVNALARQSLYKIGDSCWHCHAGVASFPLQIGVKFKIPLIIWGESAAESSGRASYYNPIKFDRNYALRVSSKCPPSEMVNDSISLKDLVCYQFPSGDELENAGIVGVFLGDYLFWDDERQMELVRDYYGWREGTVEGTYKGYKSVECKMAGVHDYTCFLKRGYGRGTFHASADVRAGLLTREEGFELAKLHDTERPKAFDTYLEITGFSEQEAVEIVKSHRTGKCNLLP